ncbi:MAG: hypothetical protein PVJ07_01825 [Anaerolineales bacterium]|jgi:hypothetical protein
MNDNLPRRSSSGFGGFVLNCLTTLILLATVTVGAVLVVVFFNPQLPINPFPPPALPTSEAPPTATNTPESSLPPEWTDTPSPTPIPSATATPSPSPTATELTPSVTAEATQTEEPSPTPTESGPPYGLQQGSPAAIQRWWPPYDELCEWMGVGGHVFDIDGQPIIGLGVHLEGQLAGNPIELDTLSGSASDLLGGSGYLFNLAETPIASEETLWIQLIDLATELPLSDKLYLTTYDTCESNLILVNWRKLQ